MISYVTGATGYLGGCLLRGLLESGDETHALVRNLEKGRALPDETIAHQADICDLESLRAAIGPCDRIFHTAAMVKMWHRDPRQFARVNIDGALNVAQVAMERGCRLVYTSSFFALGPTATHPVTETHSLPNRHCFTDYERTKTLSLQKIRERAANGLDAVILLPTVIYGPGAMTQGNLVGKMALDLLKRRFPGIPGDGQQIWTFSHIEDVAAGHLLAADKGVSGESYLLGGTVAPISSMVEKLSALLGVACPRLHVPIGILKGLGWISERCCCYYLMLPG